MSEEFEYDVALSFSGDDREFVSGVAEELDLFGVRVFYDAWEQPDLWGRNLVEHLGSIYSRRAKYCMLFVSESYVEKHWPRHERQHAHARQLITDDPYMLPVILEDVEVPGLPSTVGFIDAKARNSAYVAVMFLKKMGAELSTGGCHEILLDTSLVWQVGVDGRLTVEAHRKVVNVANRPLRYLRFSESNSPKLLMDLIEANDLEGPLPVLKESETETQTRVRVEYRTELSIGDSAETRVRYSCPNYFNLGRDSEISYFWNIGIRVKRFRGEFRLPPGMKIDKAKIFREIDGASYDQKCHVTLADWSQPVVKFSYRDPPVGTSFKILCAIEQV